MTIIDTHAHLNFGEFNSEWKNIISECQKNNTWVINIGSQLDTSQKAVEIAQNYDSGVYAAVGLHPIHVLGSAFHPENFEPANYKKLIESSKKVVAVGEVGIDFFHDDNNFDKQKEVFIQSINLAKEYDLPIVVHGRNSKDNKKSSYQEILKVLKQQDFNKGVVHCYGGTLEEAKRILDQGFYIGFTGIVTFPKSVELQQIAKEIELERILIETDSPYLAPVPHRGEINTPLLVKHVAEKIAEIRKTEYNKIVEQTTNNAIKLFNL